MDLSSLRTGRPNGAGPPARVTEGGPGLPPEGTPWDSAMPVWRQDLTDEQKWKAVMAAYDLAGVEPRKPEKLESAHAAPTSAQAKPGETPESLERGKKIYVKRCGVPGTAMSGWTTLSAEERWLVIGYVKQFSGAFKEKSTVVRPAKEPSASPELVARGKQVYTRAKCWECPGGPWLGPRALSSRLGPRFSRLVGASRHS